MKLLRLLTLASLAHSQRFTQLLARVKFTVR